MNWIAIDPIEPAFSFSEYHSTAPARVPAVVQIAPYRAAQPRTKLPRGWEDQCKAEYDLYVMNRYLAAEDALIGYLLNDRGRAAGITNDRMFYRPWSQVRGYAGEELLAWIAENGETMTAGQFRAQYRAGVEVMA